MAYLNIQGFENFSLERASIGGSNIPVFNSSDQRSGGKGCAQVQKITTGNSYMAIQGWNSTYGVDGGFVSAPKIISRIYVKFDVFPSSGSEQFIVVGSGSPITTGSNQKLSLRINSDKTISMYDSNDTLVQKGTTVLTQSVYYCLFLETNNGTSAPARLWINQPDALSTTYEINATCNQGATNIEAVWIGSVTNKSGSSYLAFFDDILQGDTASEIKQGRIIRASLSANGSPMAWTGGTAPNNYTVLNSNDGNTSYLETTGTATEQAQFIVQSKSELGLQENDRCRGVRFHAQLAKSAAGSQQQRIGLSTLGNALSFTTLDVYTAVQPTYEVRGRDSLNPSADFFSNPIIVAIEATNGGAASLNRCSYIGVQLEIQSTYGVKNEKIFFASLSSKDKKTGLAKPDIYVGTRTAFLNELMYDIGQTDQCYGILREIQGLGQSMGEVVADDKYGSLVLDATRGTIDFDKRIYDRFERDTFLHQKVVLYSFQKPLDIPGIAADLEVEFSGTITNLSVDVQGKKITLTIKSEELSFDAPQYQATKTNFPLMNDNGSGRFLPLIFGSTEVQVLTDYIGPIDDGDKETDVGRFIYGTNYPGIPFVMPSPNNYVYVKEEDEYRRVTLISPAFVKSPVFFDNFFSNSTFFLDQIDLLNALGRKIIGLNNLVNLVMGAFQLNIITPPITVKPLSNIQILKSTNNSPFASVVVAEGQRSCKALTFTSTTYNNIVFKFITFLSDFFAARADVEYTIYPNIRDNSTGVGTTFKWGEAYGAQVTTNPKKNLPLDPPMNEDLIQKVFNEIESTLNKEIPYEVYAVAQSIPSLPTAGYLAFDLVQYTPADYGSVKDPAAAYGFTNFTTQSTVGLENEDQGNPFPSFSKLDMIAACTGFYDSSSTLGEVGYIERADQILKFLWYVTHGNNLSGIDTTRFSAATYAPILAGATEGKQTYRDLALEILENAACKLVPVRLTGDVAIWAYGVRQDIVATITEADCTFTDIEISGLDAIVNRVKVNYDKRATPLNTANLQQGQTNYAASYVAQDNLSISLYGTRDFSDDFISLNFVKSQAAAKRYADYKLAQYSKERTKITFRVPFWKNDYRKIELMDIVRFSHIDNPSYFGSQSSNAEPPMTTDGIDMATDFALGDVWRRCREFPVRIISRIPLYSTSDDESSIEFKALVLDNPDEIY